MTVDGMLRNFLSGVQISHSNFAIRDDDEFTRGIRFDHGPDRLQANDPILDGQVFQSRKHNPLAGKVLLVHQFPEIQVGRKNDSLLLPREIKQRRVGLTAQRFGCPHHVVPLIPKPKYDVRVRIFVGQEFHA
jgi:hypothetical protein